jgi:serine protease Do
VKRTSIVTGGPIALATAILVSAAVAPITGPLIVPTAEAAGTTDPDLPTLVASLLPSVVNITVTRYEAVKIPPGQSVMAQAATPDKSIWYGTGFIVTADGYVVTNKHVARNGISYRVTLASDGSQFPADLVALSICCDIAVLKIRADRPFRAVKLGDSDTLRQGESVIAIGNPLGFNSTVTTGIISALNRDFQFTPFDDYIQTDAAINEGNSGGPMFYAKGEVVGVNSALYTTATSTGNIGIGLAVPINDAKFIVAHVREFQAGKAKPGYLGAGVQSLNSDLADAYALPGPWGSLVLKVDDGSPAAQAGLRPGDIITSFGANFTPDSRALMRHVIETSPGATVNLGFLRGGTEQTVPVTLAGLPPNQSYPTFLGQPGVPKPQLPPEATTNFGLEMASITPELRDKYKLDAQQPGVVITGVAIGSAAANGKINAGSVIRQVRDTPVTSPDDVQKAVDDERKLQHRSVPMLIAEPSGLRWVPLQFE